MGRCSSRRNAICWREALHSTSRGGNAVTVQHVALLNWRDRSHPRAGGAELYCEQVAQHLVRQGVAVTYLTARVPGLPTVEDREGFRIVRMGGTFTVYLAVLLWLWRHRTKIDGVIDSQNGIPFFSPLAVGRRVPVVLLIHHVHQRQFAEYFGWPMRWVGRWLEKTATGLVYGRRSIVTVSPSSRNAIRQELRLKGNVFVAPCGMDRPNAPDDQRRAARPRIVCVSRLVPHKRMDLVLEAVAKARTVMTDLELHLVGDGPELDTIRTHITRLGLETTVVVHGRVTDAERTAILQTAWITVSASAGEGWGLSILEAAALGVPAVALHVPGVQDAVRDGRTGVLIDDESQLADAIVCLIDRLSDPAEATAWASRAWAWSGQFTWERSAGRIRLVLEAEAARLALRRPDHRAACDVVTVVELAGASLPDADELRMRCRHTDTWSVRGDRIIGLIHGADEIDALAVLQRAGVRPSDQVRVRLRVGRPHDLLEYA
ncbi:glycosyltransferase family 4 protein [Dactylosporangium sp. NPDC005555]|uniref:glycosyltransferase family 4 protein n=1 Tax=Dactylosporangium sp. NPDC005555 TaxID=3154889 RepID=UPI0033B6ECE3